MVAITDTIQFSNNATATLNNDALPGDGSIVLTAGQGARFPTPGAGQFFVVTLFNTANGDTEVCNCINRSGDVLGLERAQEGTSALTFPSSTTVVQMRPTAGIFSKFIQTRFTGADVGRYLKVESSGLVTTDAPTFTLPPGISYLANVETHTAGKGTAEVEIFSTAGAANINPAQSNAFYLELIENVTLTMGNGLSGQVLTIAVQQDGVGGRTLTFSGPNIRLTNGVAQVDIGSITHYSARWVEAASLWIVGGVSAFVAV